MEDGKLGVEELDANAFDHLIGDNPIKGSVLEPGGQFAGVEQMDNDALLAAPPLAPPILH
ncbi:hypothetical protein PtA15_12A22 [Puccinia triticina]|uniref:Uncharacterized protein n=1 Tax=Puccinia triticina TaxID=208348 RepID=A0ABY7D023_9BASI|nr:uncharacterized protein PtA15_12A22 [Puccinia triticina]WAQ90037.1 hypothetical protein PtA15_12A22 [Puccinia triticina]